MTHIEKAEAEKLLKDNPHLRKYVTEIEKKMERPIFYSKLPMDVKEEEYPNLIYATKGLVFIHVYKKTDMENSLYHAITPILDRKIKVKLDQILELIYEIH